MYSVVISPPSSDAGDESASEEEQTCTITKPNIFPFRLS